MYPEAGGSSSFARRAFNEFWSFFAAWAQMLNYTITIAISAFFVPHYLGGVFGLEALRHSPADIFVGIAVVVLLSAVNVVGVKESAGVNVALAVTDFMTQLLLVAVGLVLVFSPDTLVNNVHLGVAPSWKDFFLAIPVGHDRLHRHRDDLEHGRGGQGRAQDDPGRDQPRRDRRLRDLRAAARGGAQRPAGRPRPGHRQVPDAARPDRGAGRLRGRPDPRRGQADPPRRVPAARGDLRRAARRDDPVHRDERRRHRRLAPGLLDGHPPPGARPPAPAAPEVRHAVDRHPAVRRDRVPGDDPGQGGLPRATCTRSGRCCRSRSRTCR